MKKLAILAAAAVILTGCATIVSGPTQSISFSSTPDNAIISDNGVRLGRTPLSAKLARSENHTIVIELEGYEPYEVVLKKGFNAWYLGNIVFGGLIGLVVDPLTGAMYKLTPDQVNAQFGTAAASRGGGDIHIAVSLTPDPDWEYIGSLTAI